MTSMISNIPESNSVKIETDKIKENSNDGSTKIDVDTVFESDLTTDAETDAEAETVAKKLSHQIGIFKKLEEEYAEINSYRERLKTNIDNYAKLLRQIDFGSPEDTKPSEFVQSIYDRLEEHKTQMLVMIDDSYDDLKISLKEIVLKQILNKRAMHIDENNNIVYVNKNWHLALNKIILNPAVEVSDFEFKLSNRSTGVRSDICLSCRYNSLARCINCINKNTSVEHTHPFNKKLLAVLYTQINSANIEKNYTSAPVGPVYNCTTWQQKLFSLFSHEKIQLYETPEIGEEY